jgi:Fic/DOC family
MLSDERERVMKFCEEEVRRQRDDPVEVPNLFYAWDYAVDHNPSILTVDFILQLGFLAKPSVNNRGFRKYPIRIGYDTRSNERDIPVQVIQLCELYNEGRLTPQELYMEYEYIHPFGDGNGRTGKILFNWANKTLLDPVMPENPFGWAIP